MSFLNPVNEPVLRFKSTDAGAPQINYNARVAGDVKTIIKACLVTGYGAKSSAGWSIVNEVDHVCEFVSPNAEMSDYRLGIDDTSASSTTWFYQYQNERVNPTGNTPSRSFSGINQTNAENGWQLIVTQRGFYFVEQVFSTVVAATMPRVTLFGQVKLATTASSTENMSFWIVGWSSPLLTEPKYLLEDRLSSYRSIKAGVPGQIFYAGANLNLLILEGSGATLSSIALTNPLYLTSGGTFVGEHPGLLLTYKNAEPVYGVSDGDFNGRAVLHVPLSIASTSAATVKTRCKSAMIYLDYWEY